MTALRFASLVTFCLLGLWAAPCFADNVVAGRDAIIVKDGYVDQSQTVITYQTTYQKLDGAEVKSIVAEAVRPVLGMQLQASDARLRQIAALIRNQLELLTQTKESVDKLETKIEELQKLLGELGKGDEQRTAEITSHISAARAEQAHFASEMHFLIRSRQLAEATKRIQRADRASARLAALVEDLDEQIQVDRRERIGMIAATAVSVAGAAVGVTFLVQAQGTWNDAEAACPDPTACPDDRGHELSRRAQKQATVATVGFAVSGVGLAVLGGLLLAPLVRGDGRDEPARQPSVGITLLPGGAGCFVGGTL